MVISEFFFNPLQPCIVFRYAYLFIFLRSYVLKMPCSTLFSDFITFFPSSVNIFATLILHNMQYCIVLQAQKINNWELYHFRKNPNKMPVKKTPRTTHFSKTPAVFPVLVTLTGREKRGHICDQRKKILSSFPTYTSVYHKHVGQIADWNSLSLWGLIFVSTVRTG